jgi:hypothetical protein
MVRQAHYAAQRKEIEMLNWLPFYLRWYLAPLMLSLAEAEPEAKGGSIPTWAIILIVVVVVLCVLPICVIALLALLGPAIGNVFSNIVDSI